MNGLEKIADEIVDELRGTAGNLQSLLEEKDVVDNDIVLRVIDDEIFECIVCNWWCDMSELSENDHGLEYNTCSDCDP